MTKFSLDQSTQTCAKSFLSDYENFLLKITARDEDKPHTKAIFFVYIFQKKKEIENKKKAKKRHAKKKEGREGKRSLISRGGHRSDTRP